MTHSVFRFNDYKEFLHALIAKGPKGQLTRLAEAAGCQRSYMSDVLRNEIQLTPDHADGIARFIGLSDSETDYFLDLVSFARASSKAYRDRLRTRITAAQHAYDRLTKRIAPVVPDPFVRADRYYANWYSAAIHIATSIPGLDSVSSLSRRLRLSEAVVEATLRELEDDGFVVKSHNRYRYNHERPLVHLPDESVLSRMNHSNWRNLTLSRASDYGTEAHYSVVFAVGRSDYQVMREQLLDFIQAQRRTISSSGCEDIGYFGCDLFLL